MRRRDFLLLAVGTALTGCVSAHSTRVEYNPGVHYTVQAGDTLSEIAFASGSSVYQIIRHNHLDGRTVRPGDVLFLPGAKADFHRPHPQAAAHDAGPRLRVVRRATWHAQPARGNFDPMGGIDRITIHHTGEIPGLYASADAELIARVQHHHRDNRGWADIGYHYLVGRDGRIYEGRTLDKQGAHCGGANNRHNLGIAIIGDFATAVPTGKQERALRAFLEAMQKKYGVAIDRVYGHRDFNGVLTNSDCPGDGGYAWLQRYKATHGDGYVRR